MKPVTEVRKKKAQKAKKARQMPALKTVHHCQCGTEFALLMDHPGDVRLCRKCANSGKQVKVVVPAVIPPSRALAVVDIDDPDRIFVGDVVALTGKSPLHEQWQYAIDPTLLDMERTCEPLYARLGLVTEVMEDGYVEVQSLRFPYAAATKAYIPYCPVNQIEKVGRQAQEGIYELYPFASFIHIDMLRHGRTNFKVRLPVKVNN